MPPHCRPLRFAPPLGALQVPSSLTLLMLILSLHPVSAQLDIRPRRDGEIDRTLHDFLDPLGSLAAVPGDGAAELIVDLHHHVPSEPLSQEGTHGHLRL